MIYRYVFGRPFETEAIPHKPKAQTGTFPVGSVKTADGFAFSFEMDAAAVVYGLGENLRGINKRGYRYVSNCTDDPRHTEDKVSLYGAHNFIIVEGAERFGLFFDYPAAMTFDIGYTRQNGLRVSCERADLEVYLIEGRSAYDIARQFRGLIGRSYIPPRFAFGYGQSRWGYKTRKDFETVAEKHRSNRIPLDMIYMDIDYMDHYKDFTVNPEEFPDFPAFVRQMRDRGIHLIPIIDAGVKIEEGYQTYEEGVANHYFCKRADGSDFVAAVWPGRTHFPDVLNPQARKWFGDSYRVLVDAGIDGFWNDMNEPAIFYTDEGLAAAKETMRRMSTEEGDGLFSWEAEEMELANRPEDYERFYHNVNGEPVNHAQVHNLFGYNMTRAAGEALERMAPERRMLLFSRSSYIGMHRYGGIWTGDNKSWWSHLLLNIKMLPSLNMCGFLYIGADLGGFGEDTTRDLLLRWLALGVFTPLMRNHSGFGTREQEAYQFEGLEDFRHVIGVRYRLLPYLYSEYMKAALNDDLYFRPLGFDYPQDPLAVQAEDQLMLGHECMIAPVYTQNAAGRYVYLPEEMLFIRFLPDGSRREEILPRGHHYIAVALNEVPLFIRKGKCIPLVDAAENVENIRMDTLELCGYEGASYTLYEDDGYSRDYENPEHYRMLRKQ